MPKAHQIDFARIEFRSLTPEQHDQIVRRAHAEQAKAIRTFVRAAFRKLRRGTAASMRTIRALALRVAAACNRLTRRYAEWRAHRLTMAALSGLSDSSLKDIGVCRSEIAWAAQHGRIDRRAGTVAMARPSLPAQSKPAAEPAEAPPPRKHAA